MRVEFKNKVIDRIVIGTTMLGLAGVALWVLIFAGVLVANLLGYKDAGFSYPTAVAMAVASCMIGPWLLIGIVISAMGPALERSGEITRD